MFPMDTGPLVSIQVWVRNMQTRRQLKRKPEFMELVRKHMYLDKKTGELRLNDTYANLVVNVCWDGKALPVPYSHLVWFLTHGRWPKLGMVLDHINNNPLDNRIENLQEVTEEENHRKRRGRKIYRSYGSGKYGHGINIYRDKRSGRFYVRRYISRGLGGGRYYLGVFDSLTSAKEAAAKHVKAFPSGVDTSQGQ